MRNVQAGCDNIKQIFFSNGEYPALETMKEGHDGSGLGLTLKGLGAEFTELKKHPIMSGICSKEGIKALDDYMKKTGSVSNTYGLQR